jgi:hypothetical protein
VVKFSQSFKHFIIKRPQGNRFFFPIPRHKKCSLNKSVKITLSMNFGPAALRGTYVCIRTASVGLNQLRYLGAEASCCWLVAGNQKHAVSYVWHTYIIPTDIYDRVKYLHTRVCGTDEFDTAFRCLPRIHISSQNLTFFSSDWFFSWAFVDTSCICFDSCLEYATTAFLHILAYYYWK